MKKNILLSLVGLLCHQVGLINAMQDMSKLSKDQLNKNLLIAALDSDDKGIKELINAGADVNTKDQNGATPLHLALYNVKNPSINIITALIAAVSVG